MKNRSRGMLLVATCMLAYGSPLSAQEVPDPAGPENVEEGSDQVIVVTGSRIARRDYTAESPILTIDEEFIENSGPVTVEQALNALPQFQASQGAQTSSIGAAIAKSRP